MKMHAALLMEQPGKWEVCEVDLDRPHDREVLVRIVASGLCHSDDHVAKGDGKLRHFPYSGGHEVAGIIEELGPGVHGLEVGDHIVTSFIPGCGRCRWCASGAQNLCDSAAMFGGGTQLDGTYRVHLDGRPVARSSMIGGFAEFSVMPQSSCVKIPSHIPLRSAALIGCGVPTGWGSAVNAAEVAPGHTVIVMGAGGIGIHAVQGAAHAGASHVIVAEPIAMKRDVAARLGATAVVASIGEAADLARSVTNGQGADSVIVAVGVLHGDHIAEAFDAIRKAGTVVVTAVAPSATIGIPVNLLTLAMYQKRIQGCLYGMMSPSSDMVRLLELYEQGRLELDSLVTRTYSLDEINQGYEDLHAGVNIRGVLEFG